MGNKHSRSNGEMEDTSSSQTSGRRGDSSSRRWRGSNGSRGGTMRGSDGSKAMNSDQIRNFLTPKTKGQRQSSGAPQQETLDQIIQIIQTANEENIVQEDQLLKKMVEQSNGEASDEVKKMLAAEQKTARTLTAIATSSLTRAL